MENEKKKVDWLITLLPLAIVVALCVIFFVAPDQSNEVLSKVRFFFGDTMGTYYLVIGLGYFFALNLHCMFQVWQHCSWRERRKAKVFFLCMGSMMFTCGFGC